MITAFKGHHKILVKNGKNDRLIIVIGNFDHFSKKEGIKIHGNKKCNQTSAYIYLIFSVVLNLISKKRIKIPGKEDCSQYSVSL